jgi:MFS family permease
MTEPSPKPARHDPYGAFRLPDFRNLVAATFLAGLASQMQAVAVGWDVYERTGSAMALGWVGLVQIVPVLLLFLPAGQMADRYDRRNIMVASLALSVTAAAALAYAGFNHASVGWLYLACAAGSAAQTLNRPARAALMPSVVPAPMLENALTWSSGAFQFAAVAGPAVAGLLIASANNAAVVYTTGLGLLLLALLFATRVRRQPMAGKPSERTWRDLFAGVTHVWKTQVILAVISMDLLAVLFGGATALLPIYAKDILQVGPTGLGWLAAATPAGACLMAIAQGHLPPSKRAGARFLWAVAGFGVATIVFGLSIHFWLSLLALAALGALDNISVVTRQTVVQSHTPDALRGRVSSVNSVFISTSNELGAFESGLVAALTSPVFAVTSGGVATVLLVAAGAMAFPEMRRMKSLTRQGT